MNFSKDCDVTIYTESGKYEKNSKDYDYYWKFLKGTNIIYLRKENGKILISISGIICRKGLIDLNCLFFCGSFLKDKFLLDFSTSIENKCSRLGLSIDDNNFLGFFKSENDKKYDESEIKAKIIYIKENLIKTIPSFYIPRESAIDIIEKTIKLEIFKSVGFSFSDREIKDVNLDILYYYGRVNDIIPTRKTEKKIEEMEKERAPKLIKENITKTRKFLRFFADNFYYKLGRRFNDRKRQ
ncbi:Uncharacterised protein [uncultured archaeon]|nr:Uncharacterised protein [uncultured archaeon]